MGLTTIAAQSSVVVESMDSFVPCMWPGYDLSPIYRPTAVRVFPVFSTYSLGVDCIAKNKGIKSV